MGMERVFEAAWMLRKLRSGPLGHLLEGFCEWLLGRGYSRGCIRTHLANAAHFNAYLGAPEGPRRNTITAQDVDGFLDAYPHRCRNRGPKQEHVQRVGSSVRRFCEYLREEGRFDPVVPPSTSPPLLDAYLRWMRDYQHAAPATLKLRRGDIARFLEWMGPDATTEGLAGLTAERVERFFIDYAQGVRRSARRAMQSALRTFFRYCLHEGMLSKNLDLAVPTLRTYKLSTVPQGLNEAQARTVLASVDRSKSSGRRDYAILQLLHAYGVRGGQVRGLRLNDIGWTENTILFRAAKNGKDSLLPLTEDVGASLLDYLRHARPRCSFAEVFLTCQAPYHPLLSPGTLSHLVANRIRAAGIDIRKKGSHTFRHGFATRMVAKGHSLKAVADVLGHRHLSTTFIYTKVDFNELRQVALDWPEEVSA